MKKTIGIILREFKSNSNVELLGLRADLITYLRKYKIRLITIPISYQNNKYDELEKVLDIINFCHGIIFPGGSREEELDLQIINYLYIHNIPTLGLCLGAQEMALSFGGCLDQLSSYNHQSQKDYVHKVKIKTNSKLYEILKNKEIIVNSRHNDYICTTNLEISAISEDLIIEAVEAKEKTFFLGVQWHPESLFNDINSQKIFDAFINSL